MHSAQAVQYLAKMQGEVAPRERMAGPLRQSGRGCFLGALALPRMRMRPGGLAVANGDGAKGDWCGPRYALLCSMNTSEADGHQQAGAAWELPQGMLAFDPPAIRHYVFATLGGKHFHDEARHISITRYELHGGKQ